METDGDYSKGIVITFPLQTPNKNVSRLNESVLIVAERKDDSQGEHYTTFYIDNEGNMWAVGDWIQERPRPSNLCELCRLTGMSEQEIFLNWQLWLLRKS